MFEPENTTLDKPESKKIAPSVCRDQRGHRLGRRCGRLCARTIQSVAEVPWRSIGISTCKFDSISVLHIPYFRFAQDNGLAGIQLHNRIIPGQFEGCGDFGRAIDREDDQDEDTPALI